ncbi:MAG: TIGR00730 family Rossman fold protein [Alphaproteobacteria bacterium]|nr:TIGR00730 family Rossman fold protein [Alphaproteobacteria bacterium]
MGKIESIVVYCGGADGDNPIYREEAYKLGRIIAESGIKLIYGAGGRGVMGAVAEGAMDRGGYLIGATIQEFYDVERPDLVESKIQQFEVWDKMSDRKVSMTKQASAICVLPGGYGTFDELFEMLTLKQKHIIRLPIIVVNIDGFFNTARKLISELRQKKFIQPADYHLPIFVPGAADVIPAILRQTGGGHA